MSIEPGSTLVTQYGSIAHGDALEILRRAPSKSVDLVFGSGPYEAQRRYAGSPGVTSLAGETWVEWMLEIFAEATRVSRGLVAFVLNGNTKNFENTATPFMLVADLKRSLRCQGCGRRRALLAGFSPAGKFCDCIERGRCYLLAPAFRVRKPPIFARWGTPGSGGPDWLRDNYELIVCATSRDVAKLPWSDNTAVGEAPKYATGGAATNRAKSDKRSKAKKYAKPTIANPGNVRWHTVGGGLMGSQLAHDNEAPFPQSLAREFCLMFCPPGGVVLDPFSGSGTTAAAAIQTGRRFFVSDVRISQVELTLRRISEAAAIAIAAAIAAIENDDSLGVAVKAIKLARIRGKTK